MMFTLHEDGSVLIVAYEDDAYWCTENSIEVTLDINQLQELKAILCKDCPERIEYQNYCENKAERGK